MSQRSDRPVVLVAVHGSRNAGWGPLLRDWFQGVYARVTLATRDAAELRLSYLEINEPSFESELLRYREYPGPVFLFPFFLTRSGHAGDEIPGNAAAVFAEHGNWHMISPEGWEEVLGHNAEQRLESYGADPAAPVIVSGYGSSGHDENWRSLIGDIRKHAGVYTATEEWHWAPAGHFLADDRQPLRATLQGIRAGGHRKAAILPLYLSISSYQQKLIPDVIAEFPDLEIAFRPDAILPDGAVETWAARRITEAVGRIEPMPNGVGQ